MARGRRVKHLNCARLAHRRFGPGEKDCSRQDRLTIFYACRSRAPSFRTADRPCNCSSTIALHSSQMFAFGAVTIPTTSALDFRQKEHLGSSDPCLTSSPSCRAAAASVSTVKCRSSGDSLERSSTSRAQERAFSRCSRAWRLKVRNPSAASFNSSSDIRCTCTAAAAHSAAAADCMRPVVSALAVRDSERTNTYPQTSNVVFTHFQIS